MTRQATIAGSGNRGISNGTRNRSARITTTTATSHVPPVHGGKNPVAPITGGIVISTGDRASDSARCRLGGFVVADQLRRAWIRERSGHVESISRRSTKPSACSAPVSTDARWLMTAESVTFGLDYRSTPVPSDRPVAGSASAAAAATRHHHAARRRRPPRSTVRHDRHAPQPRSPPSASRHASRPPAARRGNHLPSSEATRTPDQLTSPPGHIEHQRRATRPASLPTRPVPAPRLT